MKFKHIDKWVATLTMGFAIFLAAANAAAQEAVPAPEVPAVAAVDGEQPASDAVDANAAVAEEKGVFVDDEAVARVNTGDPLASDTDELKAANSVSRFGKRPSADNGTLATPTAPQQNASSSGWKFSFSPYLFAAGLKGDVGARGRVAEIDLSFGDVWSNLDLGLMGSLKAQKNRFVLASDIMWVKMSKEFDTPLDLYSSGKIGVNLFVWDMKGGYRVYEGKAGFFDALAGIRLMSNENNLNFRTGILPGFDVSQRKTWATPVFGGHGLLNLSPKIFVSSVFDLGGGWGSDFTGQFYGGGGFRVKPWISLVGGYRYMKTDYDDNSGYVFDTRMSGILLGAKFDF
jgi:hypothetical protein